MKERPILFNTPMVQAILAGTKTQTRRIMKPQPSSAPFKVSHTSFSGDWGVGQRDGYIGDRLWVREAFFKGIDSQDKIAYAADNQSLGAGEYVEGFTKKISSANMPRWASRITLEIANVRVERLQDISEEDARAEGCPYPAEWAGRYIDRDETAKTWFKSLRQSINGKGSWESNPWVWVIDFTIVKDGLCFISDAF